MPNDRITWIDKGVIKVAIGNCWSGDAGVIETRGWVLPAQQKDKQRFAVGWNGLVYPVVSIGDKAVSISRRSADVSCTFTQSTFSRR